MAKLKVLLTGATGYIAQQILPTFRDRYEVTLVDVRTQDARGWAVPDVQIGDLTNRDLEKNRHFFRGVDGVIHLAYYRNVEAMGARSYYGERNNVDMAYHVYQLALEENVRRVVVASSNHAADWYEPLIHSNRIDMLYPDAPRPLSNNYYGWAKEAYEHLGFLFASGSQGRALENVQIRIGAPRPLVLEDYKGNRQNYRRDLGAYISPRDLTQLFVKSLETPKIENEYGVPFQVFYGVSGNTRAFWSIVNARQVIGYEPEDDSEDLYAADIARFLR